MSSKKRYKMVISRATIDRLGIKMYDKVSAVIAEMIANSYDADATEVTVTLPLNKWLATKSGEQFENGYEIIVEDDGHGMMPDEVNKFYLVVGKKRRDDPKQGKVSPKYKRHVIGKKGIGKLSAFGVCKQIEIISSGGKKTAKGYLTSHLTLDYDKIVQETDAPHYPDWGKLDRTYQPKHGTKIILREFFHRRTPDMETSHRQLSRRFGIESKNWKIIVQNSINPDEKFTVGRLQIETMEGTRIDLNEKPVELEDGTKLPVKGWVALSKNPYKHEEIAGVRMYARGKIVSQTRDFGLGAGFWGENTIRSYLVGEIFAEWLDQDDKEDIIRTDRQDILWNTEIGIAFQKWGQKLIKELGKMSSISRNKKAWQEFLEKSEIERYATERFKEEEMRKEVLNVAKIIGRTVSLDALKDQDFVNDLRELSLAIAPHKMLVDKLREIGEDEEKPFEHIVKIFSQVRLAELASLGHVAWERVKVIKKLKNKINPDVPERELQTLLEAAPWLIETHWTPITANKSLENVRNAFERWYLQEKKEEIVTSAIKHPTKRPDFILINLGKELQIVEIKPVSHALTNDEFERIRKYHEALEEFLANNKKFQEDFSKGVKVRLICDKIKLSGTYKIAFNTWTEKQIMIPYTWEEILRKAIKTNEAFIEVSRVSFS